MISSITFTQVYAFQVLLGGLLLIYVKVRAEHDQTNSDNPQWMRNMRASAYVGAAVAISLTYYLGPTPALSLAVLSGELILLVDAIKLHRRSAKPPSRAVEALQPRRWR